MIRLNSMKQFLSKEITCQKNRISSIIASSRASLSPNKKQVKGKYEWLTEPPSKIIFPRKSHHSIHSDDNLKSQEYLISLRHRENLEKKLQKMKAGIRVNSQSESPAKLIKISISKRRPSEASEGPTFSAQNVEFDRSVSEVLQSIIKNFNIFKLLFESSRSKLDMMSKLHGWDDDFQDVFFQNRLPRQPKLQNIKEALGLDKKTHKSKNYLNKLKLLLAELMRVNAERQSLLADIQEQKFRDQMKEIENIERNYYSNGKGYEKKSYDKMVRQTREVFDLKMRIKNKNQVIKEIQNQTGGMTKIDNFFRRQSDNLAFLETLLIKCEDQP